MIKKRKTQELQSYANQARRNLVHYERRLDDLIKLKDEGKTHLSRNSTGKLSTMIANEEAAVSKYKEILADVEQKLNLSKTQR